jgi:hypothetical protein
MSQVAHLDEKSRMREGNLTDPRYQAFEILHLGFVAAPLLAGADKFTNLLTHWENYLAPAIARLSPFAPRATMQVVGVIEIVAALLVAIRPRLGAYVVAAWLCGIILNLLLLGNYYDVALRDLGLALGALALGRLSESYGHGHKPGRGVH